MLPVVQVQSAEQQLGFRLVIADTAAVTRDQQMRQRIEVLVLVEMKQRLAIVEIAHHRSIHRFGSDCRHAAGNQQQCLRQRV